MWSKAFTDYQANFKDGLSTTGAITVPATPTEITPLDGPPARLLAFIPTVQVGPTDRVAWLHEYPADAERGGGARGRPQAVERLGARDGRGSRPGHRDPVAVGVEAGPLRRATVESYLDGALRRIVFDELERLVVEGDPTGGNTEEFEGVLNTSGTQDQPFVDDALATTRHAMASSKRSDWYPPRGR